MLAQFRPPPGGESERQRHVREGAGGLALHWFWLSLQDGSKDAMAEALDMLSAAADLMCEACGN